MKTEHKKVFTHLELVNELKLDVSNPIEALEKVEKYIADNDGKLSWEDSLQLRASYSRVFYNLLTKKFGKLYELANENDAVAALLHQAHEMLSDDVKIEGNNKLSLFYAKIELASRPKTECVLDK